MARRLRRKEIVLTPPGKGPKRYDTLHLFLPRFPFRGELFLLRKKVLYIFLLCGVEDC